jgi:hypothetical protein
MAKLIYSGIMSLDRLHRRPGWEVWLECTGHGGAHRHQRPHTVGWHVPLGPPDVRGAVRLGELDVADQPPVTKDFAEIWRTTDKVVYCTTLTTASSARTRIETVFHADAVRRMKVAAERDISVAGPNLAAHAIKAGLVDEYHLFVNPIAAGGGTSYLPPDTHVELELLDERPFSNGVVFLRYRRKT